MLQSLQHKPFAAIALAAGAILLLIVSYMLTFHPGSKPLTREQALQAAYDAHEQLQQELLKKDGIAPKVYGGPLPASVLAKQSKR